MQDVEYFLWSHILHTYFIGCINELTGDCGDHSTLALAASVFGVSAKSKK